MAEILNIYFRDNYKDMIVDCLLDDEFDNFYYFECKQYNTTMLSDAKERVTGRIDYGKIEVIVDENNKNRLINKLYTMFGKQYLKIYSNPLEEK